MTVPYSQQRHPVLCLIHSGRESVCLLFRNVITSICDLMSVKTTFHVSRIFRRRLPGNKGNSKLSAHPIIKVGVHESHQWAQSALSGRLSSDLET